MVEGDRAWASIIIEVVLPKKLPVSSTWCGRNQFHGEDLNGRFVPPSALFFDGTQW